jgi:hypothetical protein
MDHASLPPDAALHLLDAFSGHTEAPRSSIDSMRWCHWRHRPVVGACVPRLEGCAELAERNG